MGGCGRHSTGGAWAAGQAGRKVRLRVSSREPTPPEMGEAVIRTGRRFEGRNRKVPRCSGHSEEPEVGTSSQTCSVNGQLEGKDSGTHALPHLP